MSLGLNGAVCCSGSAIGRSPLQALQIPPHAGAYPPHAGQRIMVEPPQHPADSRASAAPTPRRSIEPHAPDAAAGAQRRVAGRPLAVALSFGVPASPSAVDWLSG